MEVELRTLRKSDFYERIQFERSNVASNSTVGCHRDEENRKFANWSRRYVKRKTSRLKRRYDSLIDCDTVFRQNLLLTENSIFSDKSRLLSTTQPDSLSECHQIRDLVCLQIHSNVNRVTSSPDSWTFKWMSTVFQRSTSLFLLFVFLLTITAVPVSALVCSACEKDRYVGPNDLDVQKIRWATNRPTPTCQYKDDIQCDRDHDICVTVTMDMGKAMGWWIQMGCANSDDYPLLNFRAQKCRTTVTEQRDIWYDPNLGGKKQENTRQVPQTICVCDTDRCNSAIPSIPRTFLFPADTPLFLRIAAFLVEPNVALSFTVACCLLFWTYT